MKMLLFGGAGQLGSEFVPRARDLNFEVISPVIGEIDITEDAQVRYLASQIKPDLILNFAAYTAVDKAESEPEIAYKINRDGAAIVARAAKETGARLIHVSTDYVFPGDVDHPLSETDPTGPLSVYGKSKLAGEEAVTQTLPSRSLIVRTSSLHGRHGANFVHTMLSLFDSGKSPSVVADQYMSPTWAGFLAEVLLDLSRIEASGVVHCSCKGRISWYEFARMIIELAYPNPGAIPLVPTGIADLNRPARRPQFSSFNLTKLESLIGRKALPWEDGLRMHLKNIGRLL